MAGYRNRRKKARKLAILHMVFDQSRNGTIMLHTCNATTNHMVTESHTFDEVASWLVSSSLEWWIDRQVLWVPLPRKKEGKREEHLRSCFPKYTGGFIFCSSFTENLLLCKQPDLSKIPKCNWSTFHLFNWLKYIVAMNNILIY